jgi:DNA-binding NtrC family response regulator
MPLPPGRSGGRRGWKDVIAAGEPAATVLVVDDDPEVRTALAHLLTRLGYSVRVSASAEEADQWLAFQRFHACLLDIELPRMKGVEFLGWALSRDPEMAVIMLTGLDAPEVAIECIEQGARTYLTKPVEADFLRLALRDAVALRTLLVERNVLAGT